MIDSSTKLGLVCEPPRREARRGHSSSDAKRATKQHKYIHNHNHIHHIYIYICMCIYIYIYTHDIIYVCTDAHFCKRATSVPAYVLFLSLQIWCEGLQQHDTSMNANASQLGSSSHRVEGNDNASNTLPTQGRGRLCMCMYVYIYIYIYAYIQAVVCVPS